MVAVKVWRKILQLKLVFRGGGGGRGAGFPPQSLDAKDYGRRISKKPRESF